MSDQEVRDALQRLGDRLASVETEVRVVKHDIANIQMNWQALLTRFDKLEDRFSTELKALTKEVARVNVKQERGIGFFGGVAAVFTVCASVLIALVKWAAGG